MILHKDLAGDCQGGRIIRLQKGRGRSIIRRGKQREGKMTCGL